MLSTFVLPFQQAYCKIQPRSEKMTFVYLNDYTIVPRPIIGNSPTYALVSIRHPYTWLRFRHP